MESTSKVYNLPIVPDLSRLLKVMPLDIYRGITKLNIDSWLEDLLTVAIRYTYDIDMDTKEATRRAQELALNGYKLSNQSMDPEEYLEYLIETIKTYSIYILSYIIPMGNIEVIYYDAISIKFIINKSLIQQEDSTW